MSVASAAAACSSATAGGDSSSSQTAVVPPTAEGSTCHNESASMHDLDDSREISRRELERVFSEVNANQRVVRSAAMELVRPGRKPRELSAAFHSWAPPPGSVQSGRRAAWSSSSDRVLSDIPFAKEEMSDDFSDNNDEDDNDDNEEEEKEEEEKEGGRIILDGDDDVVIVDDELDSRLGGSRLGGVNRGRFHSKEMRMQRKKLLSYLRIPEIIVVATRRCQFWLVDGKSFRHIVLGRTSHTIDDVVQFYCALTGVDVLFALGLRFDGIDHLVSERGQTTLEDLHIGNFSEVRLLLADTTASKFAAVEVENDHDMGGGVELRVRCVNGPKIEKCYRLVTTDPLSKLMDAFAGEIGVNRELLRFKFDGDALDPEDTPEGLDLEDDYVIDVEVPVDTTAANLAAAPAAATRGRGASRGRGRAPRAGRARGSRR